ncbi:MAG: hypothetical protein EOO57_18465 [Hymenobacter sp.]|nr:MAG: hypothetical protein EOO57_18465 [Hymenobacter sp.]
MARRPSARPVVVAILDGGLDTTHADLRRGLWHNPGEVPGTKQLVDFATLSRAGGVVNLYEAVRLASLEPPTGAAATR